MANTWVAYYPAITFGTNKNMAAILNTSATRLIKIRRVGAINYQLAAVTGTLCLFDFRLYTTAGISGHTTITPVSYDSSNSALSGVTAGHAGTPSGSAKILLRQIWSSDEPAAGSGVSDEWEIIPAFNYLWTAGYGDTDVQSLALRQNQMFCIYNTVGTAGAVDFWIEFTDEAA